MVSARLILAAPKPAPVSFASQPYFGVNTFKFIDAAGVARYGRYRFVPVGAIRHLDATRSAALASDYLRVEMREHIKSAPVLMKLMPQLAEQGDALEDPALPGLRNGGWSSWVPCRSTRLRWTPQRPSAG